MPKYSLEKNNTNSVFVSGFVLFTNGGKSGIRSATLFLFTCFRSTLLILLSFLLFLCRYHAGVANNRFNSYYFFVAITPGLQTTVSSVVWSACFYCCLLYRLQADFQPVRIPQLTKKIRKHAACLRIFWRSVSNVNRII